MSNPATTDPVEKMYPIPSLFALGLQHVLVMYAGAVAVPLIIGSALHLPKEQIAMLVSADLFCCGLVTIIQAVGIGNVGIRLPIMMGIAFTAVPSIIATGTNPELGMPGVIGAVIGSGVFTLLAAPYFGRWVRFFPPIVTGTVMLIIGLSLMRVGVNWAAGGQPMIKGPDGMIPNPAYGAPFALAVATIVLVAILLMTRYLKGFLSNLAVLLGIGVGFAIAIAAGKVSFSGVGDADWARIIHPLAFGWPIFEFWSIFSLCAVMTVMMVESTGQILAVGDMTGRKISQADLARGLRTDGVGNIIGGILNTFTYTTYAQNVGLLQITGVMSRWVVATGGVILILLGSLPKVAFISASIPSYVVGGAAIVMFGMVSATGVKILSKVDFTNNRRNLYIVAVSVGLAMVPVVADKIFDQLPQALEKFLHSGVLVGTFAAALLNILFNGIPAKEPEEPELKNAAPAPDAI
ncbi:MULTISPECIES: nucleobase:cation symporter-2 family protein [unclassified Ensifer]|uniref:nucleobase:cation symporter-2 family protein n=1 Tax=unclassified Ensifer TaxID=2633371 RepID=UPI000708B965|nr:MULTISPECIES: nucleobase:cation symporter-2 family protein [unclassified Ensifer]KQW50368.1 purine permease [Ensifer sp. Root1252]KRC74592.1 purine permease [Ensifer sp. Root231]KRC94678.1 purine permease [Ensifer sp. Root258]